MINNIDELETLYEQVVDRTTPAYLDLLNGMRFWYENNNCDEKCLKICNEIVDLIVNNVVDNDSVDSILLATYDTMARLGDFRAYCIALEWNRPREKQFFLPRKRILEKHGLIQAMQDVADDKLDFLFVSQSPRTGKLVSNSTPILTKKGWKKHGDLQVGDYVLNHKGRFVKIIATSPECQSNCRVTFSNGERIDCHENHEWLVNDSHKNREVILETKNMIGNVRDNYGNEKTKNHFRFGLPIIEPIIGEYRELPVEPYCLGVWLGDGANRKNCITIDKKDKIIAETIDKYYPISNLYIHKTYGTYNYYFAGLRQDLQKIDMCYSRQTCTKHIPDIYLTASLEQRLQLLAGLLDTDGTLIKKEHRYHFSTSDIELKEGFVKLVSTFGWRCSVTSREPRLSTSGIQGKKTIYTIGFNPTFEIPCRLERKQLKEFSKRRRITITNIDKIENGEMGKCIQVEGGIYLAGKTLIPTHNSTLGIFFLTFMAGLYPDRSILANGHSTSLAQSFYGEFLNIITGEEYRYSEIFPKTKIVNQNAEYLYVDLNSKKRFHTITVKSLSGGTTGLAEASNVLYCDDLIKDIEEANNPDRLDKIFHLYTSTIQDRTVMRLCKDGEYHRCPEIHIATRWSLHDVIGRLISIYGGEDNPRVKIINIPCYDENGESNFMYDYGKGFTTEYYHQLQMSEDPVIFAAKYLGEPIERDGLVFTEDTLSYYSELPEGEPDRIIAYADPSHGGDDYFSFPIGYVYGYEIYIEDIWFENRFGGDDYSRPKVCNMIVKHKVQRVGIERNNGGDFYSTLIEQDLRKMGYRCNITTHNAPTNKSKQDRILAYQNEIKGVAIGEGSYRIYFKSKEARKKNKQYNEAMQQLFKWNQSRNMQNKQHDDFPDSLAGMLSNLINGKTTKVKTINASNYL